MIRSETVGERRESRAAEKVKKGKRYAPWLSFARFGPGIITVLSLIALATIALYVSGHVYLAFIAGIVGVNLFGVKSMEIIELSYPEKRKLVGQNCVVVKEIGKGKTGIVRVYDSDGRLDPELWSAESSRDIPRGQEGEVVGMRGIVLLIEAKPSQRKNERKESYNVRDHQV
jgi:membrane protein implicated in regulation of membrane protease activity